MNVTYATFLAALMVEYAHDKIADNITSQCNVTWSRTSPIIVSACEDPYEVYLTLECDHSMGMTVLGSLSNMWMFNYICSSAISPIEYAIMSSACGSTNNLSYQSYSYNGIFGSVMLDLLNDYLYNSTYVEAFVQNGFIIEKSAFDDDNFLVIDLETGIVRDINTVNNFCGVWDNFVNIKCLALLSGGFDQPVNNKGEVVPAGTATFRWYGLGEVFCCFVSFG